MKTFCLFVRGLPGSGKSILAQNLALKFGAVVLDPDNIKSSDLKYSPKEERLKNLKYKFLLETCAQNLRNGTSVIWDQPWRKIENLQLTVENLITKSVGHILFFVIEITVDTEISWKRTKAKFSNRAQFDSYLGKYHKYNLQFPFKCIDGSKNIDRTIKIAQQFVLENTS